MACRRSRWSPWLLIWSEAPARVANRVTHIAGLAWLVVCAALAAQSFSGRPLLSAGIWLWLAVVALLVWVACAIFAVRGGAGASGG